LIRIARDESEAALADQEEALALARLAGDPQLIMPVLGQSAWILLEAGWPRDANALAEEFLSSAGSAKLSTSESFIWAADGLGLRDETRRVLENAGDSPWNEVARAILEGDFESAAERLDVIGAAPHAALARLRAGEALVEQGRFTEADAQAQKALAFWRSVGATRYVRLGEALLAASA
jgi:tetratricopeptide (TPR) repeat protein